MTRAAPNPCRVASVLAAELHAVIDCINRQPCADIIWMLPPHQAKAVHESVQQRLETIIDYINTIPSFHPLPIHQSTNPPIH